MTLIDWISPDVALCLVCGFMRTGADVERSAWCHTSQSGHPVIYGVPREEEGSATPAPPISTCS